MTRKGPSTWALIGIGALGGVTIGTFIEVFASLAAGTYVPGTPEYLAAASNPLVAVLVERLLYALLGAISGAAGKLYDSEKLSLGAATAIHAPIIGISVLVIGVYLRWFPIDNPWAYVGFILVFAAIYAVIWVCLWLYIKGQIKRANQKLAQRQ